MARFPKNTTPKLTESLIREIEEMLASGAYVETVAERVGISKDTFYRWLRDAKKPKASKLLKKLSDAVRYASAKADFNDLNIIDLHAHGASAVYEYEVVKDKDGTVCRDKKGLPIMQIAKDRKGNPIVKYAEIKPDWRAAAWKLERRSPARWGNKRQCLDSGSDFYSFSSRFEVEEIKVERIFDEIKDIDIGKILEELNYEPQ